MGLFAVDWVILGLYVAFVLAIGWFVSRRTKSGDDFLLAGRSVPAWICGLAFISANLGAQEVIGMAASGAKYGIATAHFYWVGAIPAMIFVGLFMMQFYYGSKARSAPEYLRLRFDEKTRGFNAISFAIMTVFSSGISMYAMAKLIESLHMLDAPLGAMGIPLSQTFNIAILVSAAVVLVYIYLGGLKGAIYNEALQFFLIVAGFAPLVWLGLHAAGGWEGIKHNLGASYTHAWAGMAHASTNRLGVDWFGLVMGLGFVLSFGYWCTDFLLVQRAMAADSMASARRTPLIAAVLKMFFPFLVIFPGLIALSLTASMAGPGSHPSASLAAPPAIHSTDPVARAAAAPQDLAIVPVKVDDKGQPVLDRNGQPVLDNDQAAIRLMIKFFPSGMLGLGLTALLASFMSGMAGNVTAFNTVWTYDIYQAYIRKDAPDGHYLMVGRLATFFGIALSIAAAYLATHFNNIMDLLQLVFAFINAPVFATFLLGMFWTRTTGHGAFTGLVAGTAAAAAHHGLTLPMGDDPGVKGAWLGAVLHAYPSEMAQNFYTAIVAWTVCFVVTIVVSLMTKAPDKTHLEGLVYSMTPKISEAHLPWWRRPVTWGVAVLAAVAALNFIFR
jgi:SSS family solute:Na+ symporter